MNLKKDVTLICVDGVDPNLSYKSLLFSNREVGFDNIKLLSFELPAGYKNDVEFIQIPKMSWGEYNDFVARKLIDFIDTPYCLLIQTDGVIVNSNLWLDEFFDYDYVGAPTTKDMGIQYKEEMIGGGGFTLNSKRLLEFTRGIAQPNEYGFYVNEDTSIDNEVSLYNTFGFHGRQHKTHLIDSIIKERMRD